MSSNPQALSRVRVGSLPIDVVDFEGALDAIDRLVRAKNGGTVFTPNVDHVVVAEHDLRFRAAYDSVSLSLVDGMPLLWAARLLKTPLPEKVSGSDLILPLMRRAAERGHRVYFLGGAPGAARLAREKLVSEMPTLDIVGIDDGRIDVNDPPELQKPILERIAEARPDLLLVALGAPKQEIWSHEQRPFLRSAVSISVGASLDFIAGSQRRAPRWMTEVGLEWAYRLAPKIPSAWQAATYCAIRSSSESSHAKCCSNDEFARLGCSRRTGGETSLRGRPALHAGLLDDGEEPSGRG